jgi:anti-anti-sigma factor
VAALPVFKDCAIHVTLEGDLDIFRRDHTQAKLDGLRSANLGIVDLRRAGALDATFLGQLAALRSANLKAGGTIVLVVTNPAILKLLHIVRFDRVFPIVESIEQAHELIPL